MGCSHERRMRRGEADSSEGRARQRVIEGNREKLRNLGEEWISDGYPKKID
jgi:hypothetical protein